jgi:uncharacterized membrane protein
MKILNKIFIADIFNNPPYKTSGYYKNSKKRKENVEAHIIEWLNLSIRWVHMITGIAWIGASFYFIFLENNLNRTKNLREELAGNLWAVHGGGFYYLEKYKVSPEQIPEDLHWFKYEAYFTWLSGFVLLAVVYYYNASMYMIDPTVAELSSFVAIAIGLGALLGGWIIYDLLCKSALVNRQQLFALLGFILIVALSYTLTQYLSARAAYIHVGAMIGTLMVANVFFVIIPAQKAMVAAADKGETVDPTLGKNALRRSIHNNYMTLPVLFIMISNHFPSTFGYKYSWLILAGLILVGVAVRHWFNLKGKGIKNVWLLPFALLLMLVLIYLTKPNTVPTPQKAQSKTVSDVSAIQIVRTHCQSCHSATPTSDIFATAPKGTNFDTLDEVKNKASLVKAQSVNSKIMPLGNMTGMTDEERMQLGLWLDSVVTQ